MLARRDRDLLLRAALRDRFAVTLVTGEMVEGLLYEVDSRTLVMVEAFGVDESGTRTPLDGWVYLPRDRVLYLQRPFSARPHETG